MSKQGDANLKLRAYLVRLEVAQAWYKDAGKSRRIKGLVRNVELALEELYMEVNQPRKVKKREGDE